MNGSSVMRLNKKRKKEACSVGKSAEMNFVMTSLLELMNAVSVANVMVLMFTTHFSTPI